MFELTKYDVITLEEGRLALALFHSTEKLMTLSTMLDNKEDDEEIILNKVCNIVVSSLTYLKQLAHLSYENAKDLYGIDGATIYKYLKENNLNPNVFPTSYSQSIDSHARCLLFYMIAEEEIDFSKVTNPYICKELSKSNANGLFAILDKPVTELNPDNFRLMHKMTKQNFSISELTQEEIDKLNNYHEEYMKKNIYPRVNSSSISNEEVLNYAKAIAVKIKGN